MGEDRDADVAPQRSSERASTTPVAVWLVCPDGSQDGDPPPSPAMAEHVTAIVERVRDRREPADEDHYVAADGEPPRKIRLVARPLRDGGVLVSMLEPAASEAHFFELVSAIDQVFWLSDKLHERILYVSPAYEKVWGRTCESVYQRPISFIEAIEPEDQQRLLARLSTLLDGNFDEVYRIRRPDGSVAWIRDRAFPIRDQQGEVVRIAGIATDITIQRQLEEQLVQAHKLESIGRLAGGIAHDFNNLLTVILTGVQFALRSLPADSAIRADLVHIKGAAERAARLTSQLLTFARRQVTDPTRIDLNALIRQLDGRLRRILGGHIELVCVLEPEIDRVLADRGQLEQVLIDLARNARDAMPEGGRLTLETRNVTTDPSAAADLSPGDSLHARGAGLNYVLLAVSDTGVGVPVEILPHIFDPFFTTKRPGQGLGLATCYGIVRQAGGHVLASSEPGVGTTFELYLPAVARGEDEDEVEAKIATTRGRETVLFVEDEAVVRMMGARILTEQGYRVIAAASGPDALRRAAEQVGTIDILVTDVVMPNMSGTELARQLSEQRPHMRVLYTSGYAEDSIVQPGALAPRVAFLPKPYVGESLLAKVREILDQ